MALPSMGTSSSVVLILFVERNIYMGEFGRQMPSTRVFVKKWERYPPVSLSIPLSFMIIVTCRKNSRSNMSYDGPSMTISGPHLSSTTKTCTTWWVISTVPSFYHYNNNPSQSYRNGLLNILPTTNPTILHSSRHISLRSGLNRPPMSLLKYWEQCCILSLRRSIHPYKWIPLHVDCNL